MLMNSNVQFANMEVNYLYGLLLIKKNKNWNNSKSLKNRMTSSEKNWFASTQNLHTFRTSWALVLKFPKFPELDLSRKEKSSMTMCQSKLLWRSQWTGVLQMKNSLIGFLFTLEKGTTNRGSFTSSKNQSQWSWQIQPKTSNLNNSSKSSLNCSLLWHITSWMRRSILPFE